MRKLLIAAVLLAAAWFAWQKLGPSIAPPASSPDTTPGANMKQRIDNRSGIAPE
jgi:hypothetical protein